MADEEFQAITAYGKAVQELANSTDSAASAFASAAKGSEAWTMASRILSGSGLWKLQNYVRSVGNAINIFNNNSKEAELKMIQQMESTMKLSETYASLSRDIKLASKETGRFFETVSMMQPKLSSAEASALAVAKLTDVQDRIGDRILQIGERAGMNPSRLSKYMKPFRELQKGEEPRSRFGYAGEVISGYGKGIANFFGKKDGDERSNFQRVWERGQKIITSILEVAGKGIKFFFKTIPVLLYGALSILVGVMLQVMLYGSLIAIGIMAAVNIFKKMELGSVLKMVMGKLEVGNIFLEGLREILEGVWKMLTAIFQGDFSRFFTGMGQVLLGIGKVLVSAILLQLGVVSSLIIGVVNMLPSKIGDAIKKAIGNILGFANGGITRGGLSVVGERGPELVSLPRGSRVYSNAQSQRMGGGGNNIHVHISGRVGASDAEIRDIANKVAREVNLRMNRTGSAVGRF
tara:strand:+ start:2689 stop:4077 length:1389 start_codon:yes stop_codon:yes gene_type:complete